MELFNRNAVLFNINRPPPPPEDDVPFGLKFKRDLARDRADIINREIQDLNAKREAVILRLATAKGFAHQTYKENRHDKVHLSKEFKAATDKHLKWTYSALLANCKETMRMQEQKEELEKAICSKYKEERKEHQDYKMAIWNIDIYLQDLEEEKKMGDKEDKEDKEEKEEKEEKERGK